MPSIVAQVLNTRNILYVSRSDTKQGFYFESIKLNGDSEWRVKVYSQLMDNNHNHYGRVSVRENIDYVTEAVNELIVWII